MMPSHNACEGKGTSTCKQPAAEIVTASSSTTKEELSDTENSAHTEQTQVEVAMGTDTAGEQKTDIAQREKQLEAASRRKRKSNASRRMRSRRAKAKAMAAASTNTAQVLTAEPDGLAVDTIDSGDQALQSTPSVVSAKDVTMTLGDGVISGERSPIVYLPLTHIGTGPIETSSTTPYDEHGSQERPTHVSHIAIQSPIPQPETGDTLNKENIAPSVLGSSFARPMPCTMSGVTQEPGTEAENPVPSDPDIELSTGSTQETTLMVNAEDSSHEKMCGAVPDSQLSSQKMSLAMMNEYLARERADRRNNNKRKCKQGNNSKGAIEVESTRAGQQMETEGGASHSPEAAVNETVLTEKQGNVKPSHVFEKPHKAQDATKMSATDPDRGLVGTEEERALLCADPKAGDHTVLHPLGDLGDYPGYRESRPIQNWFTCPKLVSFAEEPEELESARLEVEAFLRNMGVNDQVGMLPVEYRIGSKSFKGTSDRRIH